MSAAVDDVVARSAARSKALDYLPVAWSGEVVRLGASAMVRSPPGEYRAQAVSMLSLLTSARVRLRLDEAPRGDQRHVASAMAAAAFVKSGGHWMPPGVPAWVGHLDLHAALASVAEGLVAECRAAGLPSLTTRWRAQGARVEGQFLDARGRVDRPALYGRPENRLTSHTLARRIALLAKMSGVLVEGGRVVVFRADAIRLHPLGDGFDLTVTACGEAVARRVIIGTREGQAT